MPPPLEVAGVLFRHIHEEWGRRAGLTRTEEETERSAEKKRALLTKVAELAQIPEHRRESFVRMAESAVGYALTISLLPARAKGSAKLFDANAKIVAARNAVAMLDEQDRALIDEAAECGDIFELLDRAAQTFSFMIGGDFAPPPKRGRGSPK